MPKNFVVYKSSAGSGKTFTLVKEYLKLALSNETQIHLNYKRVLALTFTNKAASEMRIRIIQALIAICDPETNSEIEKKISEELNVGQSQIKERARKLINNLLHHYSDFGVSTIDSFSHKIIKTFAHDLKLPVNFNLETDTKEFYNKVVAQLISEIGNDKEVTTLLKEFALTNIDDELNWDPESNMQEFIQLLQKENSIEHIRHLSKLTEDELASVKEKLQEKLKNYKQTIVSQGKKGVDLLKQNHLSDKDFNHKSNGPHRFFYKCAAFEVDLKDINTIVTKAIISNKWAANYGGTESKTKIEQLTPRLNEMAEVLIQYIQENSGKYNLYDLIYKRIYPMLLLRKIQKISDELKQEEQLVFIEEFNSKIFDFIKNEPVSFIYERLGERYKHFLIDEFQDTSTLQWHNMLPLIENSLANGYFNLVVGDGKQSIYRWRNANVRQFAMLPELENSYHSINIAEQEQALKRNYSGENVLKTNYRSFSTIVEFNNAFFDHLSKILLTDPLLKIYRDQIQEIKKKDIGYITFINEAQESDVLEEFVCHTTLLHIQNALDHQYKYNDICILTDTNKKGSLIATFLNRQNIPVISSDSLLLSNCAEVNTLSAFLKFIQNGNDLVSAAVVLNYLLNSKSITLHQFHYSVTTIAKHDFYQILNALKITISETDLQTKNLLDTVVYLIEKLQLNKNSSSNIYIRFFLDEVSKYMNTKNSNINEFNTWWQKRSEKASLVISENLNAVKVMTIHGSKGLEFPIVIIPFCNWETSKNSEQWIELKDEDLPLQSAYVPFTKKVAEAGYSAEIENEIQEKTLDNMNKLYVAFTRAIEQLHIISSVSTKNSRQGVHHWLSAFIETNQLFVKTAFGYASGKTGTKNKIEKEKNSVIELSNLQLQSSIGAVKIKGSFLKNSELNENAKQKGILIHYILSQIISEHDIDSAVNMALQEGTITTGEIEELKISLEKIIHHEKLITYFKAEQVTKIECDILTDTGAILRPDRISISEHEVCIIDYKTGKEDSKKHFAQMQSYQEALYKMGYRNIKKLLVYIQELKVIEVY